MATAGIDALALLPAGVGDDDAGCANQRYLSQVGGNGARLAMLFPQTGEPTGVLAAPDEPAYWRPTSWLDDLRVSEAGRLGRALAGRLHELRLERGTIGIPSLTSAPHAAESPLPIGAVNTLQTELPHARLIDATDLLDAQRAIKSDEEIAVLAHAATVAERGLNALAYYVQAGM